ncbi:hypothetical protein M501DRAFT_991912 [Patellaria atrata CBS 101060]|uniref:Uncharacterized protein n=1 Tax=Patellaria atrata CBS 101060 TaxID=1346257 RepID=A0A9P4VS00_9PEZI|nr:hypothetical protein M501DRAFT_991912 [Patellaria atrata CBS 101060]
MAPGNLPSNRNITNFFKPFTQPKPGKGHDATGSSRQDRSPKRDILSSPGARDRHVEVFAIRSSPSSRSQFSSQLNPSQRGPSSPTPQRPSTLQNPESQFKAPSNKDKDLNTRPSTPTFNNGASIVGKNGAVDTRKSLASSMAAPPAQTPKSSVDRHESTTTASRSSLTSLSQTPPSSSFSSNGSKRTVKNGVELVQPSDTEDESDSSLELPDLDAMIAGRKRSSSHLNQDQGSIAKKRGDDQKRDFFSRGTKSGSGRYLPTPPAAKRPKYSIGSLIDHINESAMTEAKLASAKEQMRESDRTPSIHSSATITNMLVVAIDGNGEQDRKRRLLEAAARTNALQYEKVWNFYDPKALKKAPKPFPGDTFGLPWIKLLKDPKQRENAFQSGLIRAMAATQGLPDEIVLWMFDDLCYSGREDLCYSYINVLKSCDTISAPLLDVDRLNKLFQGLGFKIHMTDSANGIMLEEQLPDDKVPRQQIPHGVKWTLTLLESLSPSLSLDTRNRSIYLLLLLIIDINILSNGPLQLLLHTTLTSLFSHHPSNSLEEQLHTLTTIIFTTLPDSTPRALLISNLPTSTPLLASFRRYLALAFFLESTEISLADSQLAEKVHHHLATDPLFKITPDADLEEIKAKGLCLDIAVDSGFTGGEFAPEVSDASENQKKEPADCSTPPCARTPEFAKQFNAAHTQLAAQIRRTATRLRGGRVDNIESLVVKGIWERCANRILDTVVTNGRGGREVWYEQKEGERSWMERWVSKVEIK